MEQVVGVRFKKAGKIYYFAPNELHLQINDGVIVERIRLLLFALRKLKSSRYR